jgi:hypothetical protein
VDQDGAKVQIWLLSTLGWCWQVFGFSYFLFAAQPKEFFLDGLQKLEQQSHKCVELRGEYVKTFFLIL